MKHRNNKKHTGSVRELKTRGLALATAVLVFLSGFGTNVLPANAIEGSDQETMESSDPSDLDQEMQDHQDESQENSGDSENKEDGNSENKDNGSGTRNDGEQNDSSGSSNQDEAQRGGGEIPETRTAAQQTTTILRTKGIKTPGTGTKTLRPAIMTTRRMTILPGTVQAAPEMMKMKPTTGMALMIGIVPMTKNF